MANKSILSPTLISLAAIIATGTTLLAYSYFVEPKLLIVNRKTIEVKDWDSAFDSFKLVAIADIHGGSNAVDEAKIRKIVELANAEDPDLIVLLGDYVSQRRYPSTLGDRDVKMPVVTIADNLRGLRARYGVMAVMGNHDDWYGNGEIAAALDEAGIRVLDNQIVSIERSGRQLRVFGLRDHMQIRTWRAFSNELKQIISRDSGKGAIVVLEHSPDVLPVITGDDLRVSDDIKLMLAAHTHGGQVWLPLIGSPIVPSSYGQKYSYGHIKENGVDMFVTSGVGTSILPIRYMMPPEIAVLTIRSSN